MAQSDDESAPGWDAIDRALAPIYGGKEPRHFGTLIRYRLGGPDPLDGISAYDRDTPVPHWHFVTYGFTDLYGPENGVADQNGYGFELTLRITRSPNESEPPMWALNFLQNLARYVFRSGNILRVGDHMNCNGPIALESETSLHAVVFAYDPELGEIVAPHGKARFLQVVGITLDEYAAVQSWNSAGFIELLRQSLPLLCTDLVRGSVLKEVATAAAVQRGIVNDGSSTGLLFVSPLLWELRGGLVRRQSVKLTLGAGQIEIIAAVLRGRLGHGRALCLRGQDFSVDFVGGEQCGFSAKEDKLELRLTPEAVLELFERLQPRAESFGLSRFPELQLVIKGTEMRDANGAVVKTIG